MSSSVVSVVKFTRCSCDASTFMNTLEKYSQKADAFSMSSIPLSIVFRSPTEDFNTFLFLT